MVKRRKRQREIELIISVSLTNRKLGPKYEKNRYRNKEVKRENISTHQD